VKTKTRVISKQDPRCTTHNSALNCKIIEKPDFGLSFSEVGMSGIERKGLTKRGPLAAILFYSICILLFPVILVGYVLWIARIYSGRKAGVSGTAQGPLSARWFQHQLGTRRDEAASRLMMVLPGVSPLAVHLVFGPMRIASRLSGFVPQAFRYPFQGVVSLQNQASARQSFYDATVDRYLGRVNQFVILGAGFDTRAFRLPVDSAVRSFEVENPKTLAVKRAVLEKAGIDTTRCTFVAADFEKQDWLNRLVDAGFDRAQPALFLWEGVTPYLDREAVVDTLRKVASTARGSVLAFDYFSTEILESRALYLRIVRKSLLAGGEPLKFGIDSNPPLRERVAELLQSCGLSLIEQHTLGQEADGKRALGGFAIAIVG